VWSLIIPGFPIWLENLWRRKSAKALVVSDPPLDGCDTQQLSATKFQEQHTTTLHKIQKYNNIVRKYNDIAQQFKMQ
jgi:hypothetical protein